MATERKNIPRRVLLGVALLICVVSCNDQNTMAWEHIRLADATIGDVVWPIAVIALIHSLLD